MKQILVATDLSPRSETALLRAFQLAQSRGAEVTVIHSIDTELPSTMSKEMHRLAEEQLRKDTETAALQYPCSYRVRLADGAPDDAARTQALGADADLIVLGLHRPRTFFDGFRETTMERLVRTSKVPVLLAVTPPKADYARVLCPVDFSPASARAVATARKLLPEAEYRLFHAFHVPHPLHGASDGSDLPFRKAVTAEYGVWRTLHEGIAELQAPDIVEGAITAATAIEITAFKPDLLVIGAHSRGRLERVRLGSFARDMIRNPPLDVLISHP